MRLPAHSVVLDRLQTPSGIMLVVTDAWERLRAVDSPRQLQAR